MEMMGGRRVEVATSFARSGGAAGAAATDAPALFLLALNWLAATWHLRAFLHPHELVWTAAVTAGCISLLVWSLAAPASLARWRHAANATLRLHVPASLAWVDTCRDLGPRVTASLAAGGFGGPETWRSPCWRPLACWGWPR